MSKKIRFDFTHKELASVLAALNASAEKDTGVLKDALTAKYLSRPVDRTSISAIKFARFNIASASDEAIMKVIIHAIAVLTGRPESQIRPTSRLIDLGMTNTKKEQLRIHLNRFIRQQGSNSFITGAEMGQAATVQQVFDLTKSKLS